MSNASAQVVMVLMMFVAAIILLFNVAQLRKDGPTYRFRPPEISSSGRLQTSWSLTGRLQTQQITWSINTTTRVLLSEREAIARSTPAYDVCATFDFSPVNWTMYWKTDYSDNLESQRCQQIYNSAFKEKAVKQIIYPNGTLKNLGCNQHTKWCPEHPHWDFKRNLRINNPPCCERNTLYVLRVLTEEFQKAGIAHMVFGGGALGFARNGHWIPYDYDQDVWMDGKHWDTPHFKSVLRKMTREHGFHVRYVDAHQRLSLLYSKTNINGVGLYPWFVHGKWVKYPTIFGNRYRKPYNMIFPLRNVTIDGISTFVMNDPAAYSEYLYGKTWKREFNCKSVHDKKCAT